MLDKSHIRVCLAYDCLVCTEGPLLRYAIQHTVGQCQPSRVNWVGCGRKGIRHKILGWNVGYQIDGGVRQLRRDNCDVQSTVQFTAQTSMHQWIVLSQPALTTTTKRREDNIIICTQRWIWSWLTILRATYCTNKANCSTQLSFINDNCSPKAGLK